MNVSNKLSQVQLGTFIGMTCALVASIRNITNVAAAGWTMFIYMAIAIVLYALPLTFISGEYAGMFPEDGGPELWVTSALGKKWGFVTSWLLWVQMFPGMVMVGSVLGPMFAVSIGVPELASNNIFTLSSILVIYWIVTLLNLRFDMAKIGGRIGMWLGLYIPVVAMFILGVGALLKVGIQHTGQLSHFSPLLLFPDSKTYSTLQNLIPIMFIFTGIEMASVYMTRLKNPVKTYLKGTFIALLFMALFNVVNGLLLANVITGNVQLNNIAQGFGACVAILGLPSVLTNIFALMVLIGVIFQLSAWATGPSKTITESARRGLYPPKFGFWKKNKMGVSVNVLITQAVFISLFALLYLLVPAANTAFLLLTSATAIMYNAVYIIMSVGILHLRRTSPAQKRPFRIGGKGNGLIWLAVLIFVATTVGATVASLLTGSVVGAITQLIIAGVLIIAPLVVYARRKESWKTEIELQLSGTEEENYQKAM